MSSKPVSILGQKLCPTLDSSSSSRSSVQDLSVERLAVSAVIKEVSFGDGEEDWKAWESLRTILDHPTGRSVVPMGSQNRDESTHLSAGLGHDSEAGPVPTSIEPARHDVLDDTDEPVFLHSGYNDNTDNVSLAKALGFRVHPNDADLPPDWYDSPKLKIKLGSHHPRPVKYTGDDWYYESSHGFTTYYQAESYTYKIVVYLKPWRFICEQRSKAYKQGIPESQCLCLGEIERPLVSPGLAIMCEVSKWIKMMAVGSKVESGLWRSFKDHLTELIVELEKARKRSER
jgi:hypothetical protein